MSDVAAMIEIDRGERIVLGQHVSDAVGMPGLHRRQRGGVVAPGAGILGAGMALRLRRHERRLLPAAVRLLRPAPHRPLRPLDQRRQGPRQLCQIALMCGRLCVGVVATAHSLIRMRRRAAAAARRLRRSPRNLVVHFVANRLHRIRFKLRIRRPSAPAVGAACGCRAIA